MEKSDELISIENSIAEANQLISVINQCNVLFCNKTFAESEVQFRWDSLKGIMLMARGDTCDMAQSWEQELVECYKLRSSKIIIDESSIGD